MTGEPTHVDIQEHFMVSNQTNEENGNSTFEREKKTFFEVVNLSVMLQVAKNRYQSMCNLFTWSIVSKARSEEKVSNNEPVIEMIALIKGRVSDR